jgi:Icc-related predicted phosphoesterase
VIHLGVIGDVHADAKLVPVLARLRETRAAGRLDGVLLVGDLGFPDVRPDRRERPQIRQRYETSVARVLADVAALGVPYAWVPGNHDTRDVPGEHNADGRVLDVAGLRVHGIGGAGPDRFGFAYEWDEDEIRARDEPACDVLLVHCPPRDTPLDVVARGGAHVGSEAIRERARRHCGVLVCGHIHEAPSATRLGECLCLNVGGLGQPYGRAQVGFVRWDTGPKASHEVVHEDLESGVVRKWRLRDLPHAGR